MIAATTPLLLALGLFTASTLDAQSLSLELRGGGLAGTTTFEMAGAPNAEHLLIIALEEMQTPTPFGFDLDVAPTFLANSFGLPGFYGFLDGSGAATASLSFPAIPLFEDVLFSFQAVTRDNGVFDVSNLVRLTPQLVGTFAATIDAPAVPIAGGGHAIAPDGSLLFVGGSGPIAQRYVTNLEEWSTAGASFGVGLLSQTIGLNDGRVLFTGGIDVTTGQPTSAAAVYDPATQQTTTLAMGIARAGHGAALLGDGRVLITGGFETLTLTDLTTAFAGLRASTEIFDPATDTFASGPAMLEPRALHTSSSLANGDVLVAGGLSLLPIVNVPTVSATAYRFSPGSGSFGLPALMSAGRLMHSAIGLSDGRVLLAGGLSLDFTTFLTSGNLADIVVGTRDDCEVFGTGAFGLGGFTQVPGLQQGRAGAALATLPGGGALIAGGFELGIDLTTGTLQFAATESADIFHSSNDTLSPTGSMANPRMLATAVNLPDETVLVVGGGPLDSEVYQPE
ncbi:MAG: hypothetical protein KDB80_05580 [Planctomycetes bacterium]|nr:hypothetical protein [Planctomycetota bacterium]